MKNLLIFVVFSLSVQLHSQAKYNRVDETAIDELLSKMTLAEKVRLINGDHLYSFPGIERLNIPAFFPSDGPCSVRPELSDSGTYIYSGKTTDCATAFPTLSALAATWDSKLCYLFGNSLSNEMRARGKDMYLGPGINIMRTPLNGRTFEYLGEDPFLTAQLCVPIIKGIQSNDVGACVKHFAMNNQELNRFGVNVVADERTMREIYLPGFEAAVKEGNTWGIMGAYNKVEGDWCCENPFLLQTVLREQWKYQGIVISDWGAIHDMKKAALAGCDLESDRGNHYPKLEKAVLNGELPESVVNEKARKMLWYFSTIKKIGIQANTRQKGEINTEAHKMAAKKIAAESIVLLKNDLKILPLDKKKLKSVLVIGRNADLKLCIDISTSGGCNLNLGGGSGEAKPLYEVTALQGLKNLLGTNVAITFVDVKDYSTTKELEANPKNFYNKDFVKLVKSVDAVLLFTGNSHAEEQEGKDRLAISLPKGQDEMVDALAGLNSRTVVINQSGAPVAMPWIDKTHTVVQYWFSGQEGGNALAEMLFGISNPSGKLPCTFPKKLEDVGCHATNSYVDDQENYKEGILVGYRWFDTKKIEPLFPFGFGLSYTSFKYGKIKVKKSFRSNETLEITLPVTNSGKREGSEVVQLYVHEVNPIVMRPDQELKGFSKISLKAGETKNVIIKLIARDFSYWSIENKDWKAKGGDFELRVGSSSRDIRAKDIVKLL